MTERQNGDLPADRQKAVEHGLTAFQMVHAECDNLRRLLMEAKEKIVQQKVELDSLHQLHNMLESHIQSYMIQRDEAVAHRAAYETLFATMLAQLRTFKLPAIPIVREVVNEDKDADLPDVGGPTIDRLVRRQPPALSNPGTGRPKIRP